MLHETLSRRALSHPLAVSAGRPFVSERKCEGRGKRDEHFRFKPPASNAKLTTDAPGESGRIIRWTFFHFRYEKQWSYTRH